MNNILIIKIFGKTTFACLVFAILVSCSDTDKSDMEGKEEKNPLFTLLEPEESGFDFLNEVVNQKNFNIFKYRL